MPSWRLDLAHHLAKAPLFARLPEPVRSKLVEDAQPWELEAGEVLWEWGERTSEIGLLLAGVLHVQRAYDEETTVVQHVVQPGDAVGLSALAGEPHPSTVVAAAASTVALIPIATLRRAFRREPQLVLGALAHLARVVDLRGLLHAAPPSQAIDHRVLAWLHGRSPHGGELRITHAQLARRVGTTRADVTRALERIERSGALRLRPGKVDVLCTPPRVQHPLGKATSPPPHERTTPVQRFADATSLQRVDLGATENRPWAPRERD